MPNADAQPGDVYQARPKSSVDGDRHGNRPRPAGVVERLPNVAHCLGRTTHPDADANTIHSPKDPNIKGMTEDAYWQDRHQRPVFRRLWDTNDFKYAGTLPDKEKAELLQFWNVATMLGRRNL